MARIRKAGKSATSGRSPGSAIVRSEPAEPRERQAASKSQTVSVTLSREAAAQFDGLIRKGLVASGAVSEADNANFNLTPKAGAPKTVSVELEPQMAALFDDLIRRGLVASGAVSDADNKNFALSIGRAKKPQRKA
mgnify:CR=1 FL=1